MTEVVTVPAIGGVRIEHHPIPGSRLLTLYRDGWSGGEDVEPPIVIRHRVAPPPQEPMREVADARPFCVYYAGRQTPSAIHFLDMPGHAPEQWLVPVHEGYEYELRYSREPDPEVVQYGRDRTLFSMPLTSRRRGLVVHAAGFVVGGRAIVAPGVSEAGKSTLSRLLVAAGAADVLSDDRVVITDDRPPTVWGTPWCGDAEIMNGERAPLGAIAFLARQTPHGVRDVAPADAAHRLFNMVTLPLWSAATLEWALGMIDRLVTSIPVLEVSYPPTPHGAASVAEMVRSRIA